VPVHVEAPAYVIDMHIDTLGTAVGPHVYWLLSRATGIVAMILASASMALGLMVGMRMRHERVVELRAAHEALSLATLAVLVAHGLTLLGDHYLHPSFADVALPFHSAYKTGWMTTGILSFWALALLSITFYARFGIGLRRWQALHRLTPLAWAAGIVHSLGEGTDAGEVWFLALCAVTLAPVLALLLARVTRLAVRAHPSEAR
jgi:methionine sulfoxide reductase heme-binding subunit